MEKQTVFIKRYPSKGELPKEDGIIVMTTNERLLYNQTFGWVNLQNYTTKAPDYWLEEIELPNEEEVNRFWCQKFKKGAMFMLNKLKTKSDGK